MKKMWLMLALFLGLSGTAHAGLLLEPYVGYEMGTTSGASMDGKTSFTNMGARIGYKAPLLLWFGLDANIGMSGKVTPDSGSSTDAKRNTYYGVVGVDLPILLRGWVGYGFANTITLDDSSSTKWSGTTTKVGVGFTGLPFISINFEYIKDNFSKIETSTTTIDSPSVDSSGYMISVSLPLNI